MGGPLSGSQLFTDALERGGIIVIAVHVAEETAQFVEGGWIESAVLLETVPRALAKLLEAPSRLGHADHGNVEVSPLRHRVQRREDLLVRQVARRAEEDQGIGMQV